MSITALVSGFYGTPGCANGGSLTPVPLLGSCPTMRQSLFYPAIFYFVMFYCYLLGACSFPMREKGRVRMGGWGKELGGAKGGKLTRIYCVREEAISNGGGCD